MQLLTEKLCAVTRALKPSLHDYVNAIILGDCCLIMQQFPADSIDLVLTDPPYLVNYRSRDGRTIAGDTNDAWLAPAFAEAYRVLKLGSFCVSFYGWSRADANLASWRLGGFCIATSRPTSWLKAFPASPSLRLAMSRIGATPAIASIPLRSRSGH